MYQGVKINTKVETETTVTINGHEINEVLNYACDLAHAILEDVSLMRERGIINETEDFDCEGFACRFLDLIGD